MDEIVIVSTTTHTFSSKINNLGQNKNNKRINMQIAIRGPVEQRKKVLATALLHKNLSGSRNHKMTIRDDHPD